MTETGELKSKRALVLVDGRSFGSRWFFGWVFRFCCSALVIGVAGLLIALKAKLTGNAVFQRLWGLLAEFFLVGSF
jgi:hypothetical protein